MSETERKATRKAKRKGRAGGATMMVWMFFAHLFDPKRAAAIEHIDTARRIGSDAQRVSATAAGPATRED
jgi:hypothetical protein